MTFALVGATREHRRETCSLCGRRACAEPNQVDLDRIDDRPPAAPVAAWPHLSERRRPPPTFSWRYAARASCDGGDSASSRLEAAARASRRDLADRMTRVPSDGSVEGQELLRPQRHVGMLAEREQCGAGTDEIPLDGVPAVDLAQIALDAPKMESRIG